MRWQQHCCCRRVLGGGDDDDSEGTTQTITQTLDTVFGTLDGVLSVPVEKNTETMTVLSGTVTVNETTTYSDKPVYIENNTVFEIASGAYLIFKNNAYIENTVTFNVSANQKILELDDDCTIFIGGMQFIYSAEVYSSSFKVSSQYNTDENNSYLRNYTFSFDVLGENSADSFCCVTDNGTKYIRVETYSNNTSGAEFTDKISIDAKAFVDAYGTEEITPAGALKVLKGLAEKKSTMPKADFELYCYSKITNTLYTEKWTYGSSDAPKCLISTENKNISAKLSTVDTGKYLTVSVDADKYSVYSYDYVIDDFDYDIQAYSNLTVKAEYSDRVTLSINLGKYEQIDSDTHVYDYYSYSEEKYKVSSVSRDVTELNAEGVSLTADGSASGVIGLADCVLQNMSNFKAYSEYLKANTVDGVVNADISLTNAAEEYHYYRVDASETSMSTNQLSKADTETLLSLDDDPDTCSDSANLKNFKLSLIYNKQISFELSLESFQADNLYYNYQENFEISGISVKAEAEQKGFVSLLADSITNEFKFDEVKFLESADAYGDFSLSGSISNLKYTNIYNGDSAEYDETPEFFVKNLEFSVTLDTAKGMHVGAGFDSLYLDDIDAAYNYYDRYDVNHPNYTAHQIFSVKDLDFSIDADYAQVLKALGIVASLVGDYNGSELTEDQLKTFVDAAVKEITVSAELSFNEIKLTEVCNTAKEGLFESVYLFFGSDDTPAGQDKAVILSAKAYTKNNDTPLNNKIEAEAKISMADNAYFVFSIPVDPRNNCESYSAYDADFRVSVSGDIDLWQAKDGISYLQDIMAVKVAASADKVCIAGTGFSGELNNVEFSYVKKLSESLELFDSWSEMDPVNGILSMGDTLNAEIGSLAMCYGTYDAESAMIDKTKPYTEVVFYDGMVVEKDSKLSLEFAYRTVNSTVEDKKISNVLGTDGKYAGTAFVFDTDGIEWTVFPAEGAAEPAYSAEKIYATVPTVKITGAVSGIYPAGTQMTVKAVNEADCTGWIVSGKLYALGETVTLANDSEIVEKVPSKYTVSFTSFGNTVKTVTDVEGTAVTVPANPVAEGYVFAGWDRTVTAIGTEDIIVKALWTKAVVVEDTVTNTDGSAVVKEKDLAGISIKSGDLKAILSKADSVSKNVVIELSDATITLPESAVNKIDGDKDLTIKVVTVTDVKADTSYEKLNDSNKKLVTEGKVISITVDGAASVTDLGNVKVAVPYTLKEGETADSIAVYYLDDSGNMTKMASGYAEGEVWFETTHFSDYAIVSESQSGSQDDSNLLMYVAIIILAIIIFAAVVLFVRSRKA